MTKFTLVYVGSRGGRHTVKNVESFQQGIPGEMLYTKTDKYGFCHFYGVPAHVILTITDNAGKVVYDWNDYKNERYPSIVHVLRSLYRYRNESTL